MRAVLFGKVRGTGVQVRGPHFLRVTTPAHAAGRYAVRVVTTHGTSPVGTVRFSFGRTARITGVAPRAGPAHGGTQVTITGRRLAATSAVLFGQVRGTNLHVVSDGSLTVTAPTHRPGTVDVQVVDPFCRSPTAVADRFRFAARPTITDVSPASGPTGGGSEVTITGTNLGAVTTVLFGGAAADMTHTSANSITVITPAHQLGQVEVVASGPGGTSPIGPATVFVYT